MQSSSEPDTKVENIVVEEKYQDCTTSEEMADEQSKEVKGESKELFGYLEVLEHDDGGRETTIYLDSQRLNLDGKQIIFTENDDGFVFVVCDDPEKRKSIVCIDHNEAIKLENNFPHLSDEQRSKSAEMFLIKYPTKMPKPEAQQLQSADTQKECNETSVIVAPHTAYNTDPLMSNAVSVVHDVSSELYNEPEKEIKTQNGESICEDVMQVDSAFDSTLQSNEQIVDNACKNLETAATAKHGTSEDGITQAVSVGNNNYVAEL